MHCGLCGDINNEVRPIFIGALDIKPLKDDLKVDIQKGDYYACRKCADRFAPHCHDSFLITWTGFPCDECSRPSAFAGGIDQMPEGIVCDECTPQLSHRLPYEDVTSRGVWLCYDCYDTRHYGHRQKPLQPILDQLANL
ncbi:MAG: hypothetical protein AB7L09_00445 [Nitrospira sp.]